MTAPGLQRAALLAILLAGLTGFALWAGGFGADMVAEPAHGGGAGAIPGSALRGDPLPVEAATATGRDATATTTADGAAEPSERRGVDVATGLGTVVVRLGPPFDTGDGIRLALVRDGRDPVPLDRDFEPQQRGSFGARVAAGIWRVVVTRGPGDRGVEPISPRWLIDSADLVTVVPDRPTVAWLRVDQRIDVEPAGETTLRGTAFLDGAPAVDCTVQVAPLGGFTVAKVAADGTFTLRDVPAGYGELQLVQPFASALRNVLLERLKTPNHAVAGDTAPPSTTTLRLLASREIEPVPGTELRVDFDVRTATLAGVVLDPDGRAAPATVHVRGSRLVNFVGTAHVTDLETRTDQTGAFEVAGLAPGVWLLQATSGGAPPPDLPWIALDLEPGARRTDVALRLPAPPSVRGRVIAAGLEPGAALELWGPTRRSVPIDPATGAFAAEDLPPGRYATRLVTGDATTPLMPALRVGAAGLVDVELTPDR